MLPESEITTKLTAVSKGHSKLRAAMYHANLGNLEKILSEATTEFNYEDLLYALNLSSSSTAKRTEIVAKLLEHWGKINLRTIDYNGLLTEAVRLQDPNFLAVALKVIKAANKLSKFNLNIALFDAVKKVDVACVKLLVEAGADVNNLTNYDNTQRSVLMHAVLSGNAHIANYLLDSGADVTAATFAKHNVLYYVFDLNNEECTYKILNEGLENNVFSQEDLELALLRAAAMGQSKVVDAIVSKTEVAIDFEWRRPGWGDFALKNALIIAAQNGHANVVKILLQRSAEKSRKQNPLQKSLSRALMYALRYANDVTVKLILQELALEIYGDSVLVRIASQGTAQEIATVTAHLGYHPTAEELLNALDAARYCKQPKEAIAALKDYIHAINPSLDTRYPTFRKFISKAASNMNNAFTWVFGGLAALLFIGTIPMIVAASAVKVPLTAPALLGAAISAHPILNTATIIVGIVFASLTIAALVVVAISAIVATAFAARETYDASVNEMGTDPDYESSPTVLQTVRNFVSRGGFKTAPEKEDYIQLTAVRGIDSEPAYAKPTHTGSQQQFVIPPAAAIKFKEYESETPQLMLDLLTYIQACAEELEQHSQTVSQIGIPNAFVEDLKLLARKWDAIMEAAVTGKAALAAVIKKYVKTEAMPDADPLIPQSKQLLFRTTIEKRNKAATAVLEAVNRLKPR